MRRSPIVLGATVVGTAGVLAFHPHAPLPATATATTPSATATPTATGASSSRRRSSSPSRGSTGASGTATGDAVSTVYGDAQVRVTVDAGRITRIEALQLQGNDPRSVEISSGAAPLLEQSALRKQSADVDAVSGATFTSASYSQTLQSALDRLGFKAPDGTRATLQVPSR